MAVWYLAKWNNLDVIHFIISLQILGQIELILKTLTIHQVGFLLCLILGVLRGRYVGALVWHPEFILLH